jgi:hypothetical protein
MSLAHPRSRPAHEAGRHGVGGALHREVLAEERQSTDVGPVAGRCGRLVRKRALVKLPAPTALSNRAVLGARDGRIGGVEDLASFESLLVSRTQILPARAAAGGVVGTTRRGAPSAPGSAPVRHVLPRRRSTSPKGSPWPRPAGRPHVLVASARCLGESLDGGSDEFFEPWFIRCSSSMIVRVRCSISPARTAFCARSASFSASSCSRSASDTPEIRARSRRLRESRGQCPISGHSLSGR